MTVNTTNITSGPYSGNGIADEFSYTFRVDDKTQLIVYETDDSGTTTALTVDTDYTVAGIGNDNGGTLTRVAGALPSGYTWYIRSNYEDTQETAFASQGGFFPSVHEAAFDKLTFNVQQINDRIGRSFRLEDSYSGSVTPQIPEPVAGTYLRWNSAGTALINDEDFPVDAALESAILNVSSISSDVTTVSNNITDVQNAETNANTAISAKNDAQTALASTQAVYDDFDDRHLGSKATEPTVDNDGDPLVEGAIYWNSTNKVLRVYTGTAWTNPAPTATSVTISQISDLPEGLIESATGITASTTQTQAGATALTKQYNVVSTAANEGDSVKLLAAAAASSQTIRNEGAEALQVWPASGDAINGGTVDAADPDLIAAGSSRTYFASDATNWYTASTGAAGDSLTKEIKTASFTAELGYLYFVDVSGGAVTATLPASPSLVDSEVKIIHYNGDITANNITVARNGENIMGLAENMTISTTNATATLRFSDATRGWRLDNV